MGIWLLFTGRRNQGARAEDSGQGEPGGDHHEDSVQGRLRTVPGPRSNAQEGLY